MPRILSDGQIDASFAAVSNVQHSLTERLYAQGLATNVSDEAVLYRLEDKRNHSPIELRLAKRQLEHMRDERRAERTELTQEQRAMPIQPPPDQLVEMMARNEQISERLPQIEQALADIDTALTQNAQEIDVSNQQFYRGQNGEGQRVYMPGDEHNLTHNYAWIIGVADASKPVKLLSVPTQNKCHRSQDPSAISAFGHEITVLHNAGYRPTITAGETVYVRDAQGVVPNTFDEIRAATSEATLEAALSELHRVHYPDSYQCARDLSAQCDALLQAAEQEGSIDDDIRQLLHSRNQATQQLQTNGLPAARYDMAQAREHQEMRLSTFADGFQVNDRHPIKERLAPGSRDFNPEQMSRIVNQQVSACIQQARLRHNPGFAKATESSRAKRRGKFVRTDDRSTAGQGPQIARDISARLLQDTQSSAAKKTEKYQSDAPKPSWK